MARQAPAKPRSPRHIFISFKSEERDQARLLKQALNEEGFSVWWQEDIQCGQEWHGEIDAALASAGCVVVLWSRQSMVSPWVRHEASQAIVRGVYAPARAEPIEILPPYNRTQATDLMGWNGDPSHPGFVNLVGRVVQLMPRPLTRSEQFHRFLKRNNGAIGASTIATLAIILLVWLAYITNAQLKEQRALSHEVKRTLQPITDLSVSATVRLDNETPGVAEYIKFLKREIPLATNRLTPSLPSGVYATRSSANGVEELALQMHAPVWPSTNHAGWLFYVLRYVNISLSFSQSPFTATNRNGDLKFEIGSNDPDGSDRDDFASHISWDIEENEIGVEFNDTPQTRFWESNGRITSAIDIEQAFLKITFQSVMLPTLGDDLIREQVLQSRKGLRLAFLVLRFSGRTIYLRAEDWTETRDATGLRQYIVPLKTVVSKD